ncbi:hypothetical protein D8M04_17800 [Oceanobacillus piezotolerans]|uniref:Uncharacterized protein n=1 Tax=Oceanobacillus piezotolerans TaxID=2448030 RepID=A0A498D3U1_9BACI|nr:hypothetical protein [Oceanobacillus piezotolerans]RLL41099.1 hypothetical protein D8M04_17800 [Oceanobacillus piezotolerans]
MLRKLNIRFLFWFFLILSCILIIVIKFSPLKDIHTSQIGYLSWFHYGYELGETIFGLSISYIVSCIFYFIVVYLPEQNKRKRAMAIIENRIDNILGDMGVIIYYYFHKNSITESNDELLKEQVEKINRIDPNNKMNFSYQYIEKSTGRKVPFGTGDYTELMLLEEYRSGIQGTINSIFQIPVIINIDHDLIVILEEINNCFLFRTVAGLITARKLPERYKIATPEFGKNLFKFYLLYKELSKYIEPTEYTFEQTP